MHDMCSLFWEICGIWSFEVCVVANSHLTKPLQGVYNIRTWRRSIASKIWRNEVFVVWVADVCGGKSKRWNSKSSQTVIDEMFPPCVTWKNKGVYFQRERGFSWAEFVENVWKQLMIQAENFVHIAARSLTLIWSLLWMLTKLLNPQKPQNQVMSKEKKILSRKEAPEKAAMIMTTLFSRTKKRKKKSRARARLWLLRSLQSYALRHIFCLWNDLWNLFLALLFAFFSWRQAMTAAKVENGICPLGFAIHEHQHISYINTFSWQKHICFMWNFPFFGALQTHALLVPWMTKNFFMWSWKIKTIIDALRAVKRCAGTAKGCVKCFWCCH